MKIFIFFWLCLITRIFANVWFSSPGQISADRKIVFNLPFPLEIEESSLRGGFFLIPSGSPFNFKRILAVSGQDSQSPLVEYSPDHFLPMVNPEGYLLVEDSKKILNINLKEAARNEPGFFAKRFASTLEGIQHLPEIEEIPSKIEDFAGWNPGDSIAFTKNQDLIVNAAYGAKTFFDFGVVGRISSYWDVLLKWPSLQENPEKKPMVFLSYSVPEGFSFRFDKGGFQENVNLFKLWGRSQKITYLIDLSNSKIAPPITIVRFEGVKKRQEIVEKANALLAYQEALKGNLVIANLLSQMRTFGVKQIFEEDEVTRKKESFRASVSKLPLAIDLNFKKGDNLIVGMAKNLPGNFLLENLSIHYSQEILQNQQGPLRKSRSFAGFLQQIENLGKTRGSSKRRFAASFKFQSIFSNINREEYLEALKTSLFKIGFLDDSFIPTPLKDKIGNLELNLDISLSNIAIERLLNLPDEYPENVLVSKANEYVIEFFQNQGSANHELCENYGETDINKCVFISKKKTFEAMTNAYVALKEMKIKRNDRNYIEFLKSFGKFGNAFIENRFSIVTFLKIISSHYPESFQKGESTIPPFEIRIQIKGQNMKTYSKVLRSTFRDPNK